MLCPHCKSETEKGLLAINGNAWVDAKSKTGKFLLLGGGRFNFGFGNVTWAWRCPNCKVITITTEN